MKRTWMALAAVVGLAAAAGTAKADPGGFAPPGGPQAGFPGPAAAISNEAAPNTLLGALSAKPTRAPDRFGLHPSIKRLFGSKSCDTCNGKCGPGPGAYAPPPPVNQGTLVFPHNPYVRSPRDFFMYEPAR